MLSPLALGWVFLRLGVLFFGGGYVLIPVLHQELVQHLGWLSTQEFVDGTAISQLTPGPVAILATFAGYLRGGVLGALVATVALFLPGIVVMMALSRGYAIVRRFQGMERLLAVLAPVVTGLLLAAAWHIGRSTLHSFRDAALALGTVLVLIRFRPHPVLLIGAGALAGVLLPS